MCFFQQHMNLHLNQQFFSQNKSCPAQRAKNDICSTRFPTIAQQTIVSQLFTALPERIDCHTVVAVFTSWRHENDTRTHEWKYALKTPKIIWKVLHILHLWDKGSNKSLGNYVGVYDMAVSVIEKKFRAVISSINFSCYPKGR